MAQTTYSIGDAPVVTITCKDVNGTIADPTALTVTVRRETDVAVVYTYGTSPELTKSTVGVYKLAVPVFTTSGWRYVKATATGTNAASEQTAMFVQTSNVA